MEAYQQAMHQKYVQEQPESTSLPEFKSPIKDQNSIREGGFAHFEARLEPVGDSSLRVEWLKDGRPVEASKSHDSFSFPSLGTAKMEFENFIILDKL